MYANPLVPMFVSLITLSLDTIVFITADVAALIVQAAGGAMASIADTPEGSEQGARIMVGGILVQMGMSPPSIFLAHLNYAYPFLCLAAITIFCIVAIEYFYRVLKEKPLRAAEPATAVQMTQQNLSSSGTLLGQHENLSGKLSTGGEGRVNLTRKIQLMILGLSISTILIYIRSIYRTIEVRTSHITF